MLPLKALIRLLLPSLGSCSGIISHRMCTVVVPGSHGAMYHPIATFLFIGDPILEMDVGPIRSTQPCHGIIRAFPFPSNGVRVKFRVNKDSNCWEVEGTQGLGP